MPFLKKSNLPNEVLYYANKEPIYFSDVMEQYHQVKLKEIMPSDEEIEEAESNFVYGDAGYTKKALVLKGAKWLKQKLLNK